jgi:hypothetical protein
VEGTRSRIQKESREATRSSSTSSLDIRNKRRKKRKEEGKKKDMIKQTDRISPTSPISRKNAWFLFPSMGPSTTKCLLSLPLYFAKESRLQISDRMKARQEKAVLRETPSLQKIEIAVREWSQCDAIKGLRA